MANIAASQTNVPLLDVIEHVVGGPECQAHARVQDLDFAYRAWLAALWCWAFAFASISDSSPWLAVPAERSPWLAVPVGEERYELVPDKTIIEAWACALKELIAAVRDSKLKVSGFRAGSEIWEAVQPMEFAQEAHNPFADANLDVEYGGKRVLEFDEARGATILRSHSNGPPEVLWTDVRADSGADVLRLFSPKLKEILSQAKEQKGAPLTQVEAEEIASKHDVKENQKKIRAVLESVQGKQKQGPRGPRAKRA